MNNTVWLLSLFYTSILYASSVEGTNSPATIEAQLGWTRSTDGIGSGSPGPAHTLSLQEDCHCAQVGEELMPETSAENELEYTAQIRPNERNKGIEDSQTDHETPAVGLGLGNTSHGQKRSEKLVASSPSLSKLRHDAPVYVPLQATWAMQRYPRTMQKIKGSNSMAHPDNPAVERLQIPSSVLSDFPMSQKIVDWFEMVISNTFVPGDMVAPEETFKLDRRRVADWIKPWKRPGELDSISFPEFGGKPAIWIQAACDFGCSFLSGSSYLTKLQRYQKHLIKPNENLLNGSLSYEEIENLLFTGIILGGAKEFFLREKAQFYLYLDSCARKLKTKRAEDLDKIIKRGSRAVMIHDLSNNRLSALQLFLNVFDGHKKVAKTDTEGEKNINEAYREEEMSILKKFGENYYTFNLKVEDLVLNNSQDLIIGKKKKLRLKSFSEKSSCIRGRYLMSYELSQASMQHFSEKLLITAENIIQRNLQINGKAPNKTVSKFMFTVYNSLLRDA